MTTFVTPEFQRLMALLVNLGHLKTQVPTEPWAVASQMPMFLLALLLKPTRR